MVNTSTALQKMVPIVGEQRITFAPADCIAYGRDAFPLAYKWIQSGRAIHRPDCVVYPETNEEVSRIMQICAQHNIPITPYGGGSGIVGGGIPLQGGIVVDLKRMNRILEIDDKSLYATVQCGILGTHYEEQLNARGLTGGHYPQSIRSSTIGGWIANRGIGTFSTKYGKIDDLVQSLTVVLSTGEIIRTRNVPKSATGPNLNEIFIGSEGAFGIITEATLKVYLQPEATEFISYSFRTFSDGIENIRQVMRNDIIPAVVRLYDAREAETHFAGLGLCEGECVLLLGFAGNKRLVELQRDMAAEVCRKQGHELGSLIGQKWLECRFSTAGLCNTLRREGGVADALEVAAPWGKIAAIYYAMKKGMEEVIGGRGEVYGHSSHFYHCGGNLYVIFHAFAEDNGQAADDLYYKILQAAFGACMSNGGTLSHHHGVGIGKAKWMPEELGDAGFSLLQRLKQAVDPNRILNEGTLGL